MLTKLSNLYTIPLPPGVNPFRNPGRHWKLVNAPFPIEVKVGEMPRILFSPGQGVSFDAPDEFDRYEITNPTADVITVQFWCGYIGFTDDRRDNIESPTESVGRNFTSIAAGTAIDLVPAITGTRIRRKAIVVSNFDPAANLYVSDFSAANVNQGEIVGTVGPEQCIILPISERCRVRNIIGAPIACAVSDIYWLRG